MDVIQGIIIGLVQGLTEFLPVSSSAHLIFIQYILNVGENNLAFDVLLHLGTLMAVIIYYIKDIVKMIEAFISSILDIFKGRFIEGFKENQYKKLVWFVVVGTIPAGIVGVLFNSQVESAFNTLIFPGFFLLVTGTLLYISQRINVGNRKIDKLGFKDVVIIGMSQAIAILPGISRSGTTISTGLLLSINKEFVAKFSFLLSIPAILGAGITKLNELGSNLDTNLYVYIFGFLTAFISGYLSISILIKLIKEKSLDFFAYYCWTVGISVLIYLFIH
ncbi:MAG: undecaprenyl-diphosphate phosphatase [Methanobrevibacter sp.]|jgi:undecaprenyl-diphosphatase|nr:undecaprenyl-diphosphate phosphatase [Candidatus Methanovirga aequatorialis]